MKSFISVSCPHCHANKIAKVWHTQKRSITMTVLWCGSCGFGWQYPYPSDEELRILYKQQDLYHEKIVNQTQGGFPARISKINALKPEKGHLLDIGSGMGHFLMHARKSGWIVDGVEPRISAAKYCQKNFAINVYNGLFEEWSQKKLYDVITLWDVIEHVFNPFDLLQKSFDMLAPGGLLVVSLPNASGLPARCLKANWRYVMEPHINYFTIPFILKFIRQSHLEITRIDHSIKLQSIFEGIISLFSKKINAEKIYQMSYQHADHQDKKRNDTEDVLKKILRKLVIKFNMISYPLPIGDLVDIYCRKL